MKVRVVTPARRERESPMYETISMQVYAEGIGTGTLGRRFFFSSKCALGAGRIEKAAAQAVWKALRGYREGDYVEVERRSVVEPSGDPDILWLEVTVAGQRMFLEFGRQPKI